MYKFFDKQFLVLPDDKDIIGKKVFYNDDFLDLIKEVESGDYGKIGILEDIDIGSDNNEGNFCVRDVNYGTLASWHLAYHDPNYEAKVAYSQGKQIQYRTFQGDWVDVTDKPLWCERNVYRVKPEWFVHPFVDKDGNCIGHPFYKDTNNKIFVSFEGTEAECDAWIAEHTPKTRRMTNRELMRWLAEGKGEKVDVVTEYASLYYSYEKGMDNEECDKDTRIRAWDEDEWHEPLVEVDE